MGDGTKPTLSVSLIVKDEAVTVRRTLESAAGIADEYVIGIDQATTDDTREVVGRFRADFPEKRYVVYEYEWGNDFAAARNRNLEQCTCDWIFVLDGHEYLAPGGAGGVFWHMVNSPDYIWMVSAKLDMEPMHELGARDDDYVPEVRLWQNKLWRNLPQMRYSFATHNQITDTACPPENRLASDKVVVIHERTPSNAEARIGQRKSMNIRNLLDELRADPKDHHGLFYLAQSYMNASLANNRDRKLLRKAWYVYRRFCDLYEDEKPDDAAEALLKLGDLGRQAAKGLTERRRAGEDVGVELEREIGQARDALFRAMRLRPNRAEAYIGLGELAVLKMHGLIDEFSGEMDDALRMRYYSRLYDIYIEAEHWFEAATDMPEPYTRYFLRMPAYRFYPILALAELNDSVYRHTRKVDYFYKAQGHYQEVLRRLPHYRGVKKSLESLRECFDRYRKEHVHENHRKSRLAVAVFDKLGQFTDDLMSRWSKRYDVRRWDAVNHDRLIYGDIVFCAWADKTLIDATALDWGKPIFGRLCRFEAFTDMPRAVNWDRVTGLVVPSSAMQQYVTDKFAPSCPVHVIPHGIDLRGYRFRERKRGSNVAVVAFLHPRKGLDMLADFAIQETDVNLHIAGKWQTKDMRRYFWWRLQEGGAADRVHFHGWQDDIDGWLESVDANYLLSASWSESFGYSIGEAMAKGIKPLIRRFEGSDELWPEGLQFSTLDELLMLYHDKVYDSAGYRAWVERYFDADAEAERYLKLFREATVGAYPTRFDYRMYVDPTASIVDRSIALHGAYELGTLRFMHEVLRPGDVFIDVGAYIGQMSLHASMLVGEGGRVLAYEADPETMKRLRDNLRLNAAGNVEAFCMAIGREAGRGRIFELPGERGGASLHRHTPEMLKTDREVKISALDDLYGGPVRMVKIDVEGWELEALRGMERLLREERPIVAVECSSSHSQKGGSREDIVRMVMGTGGYKPYVLAGGKFGGIGLKPMVELPEHDNLFFLTAEHLETIDKEFLHED